ncbi:histone acetyltransferase subunit NuA4-domain-containing protein [Hysterangium stoloniferum]|nr:histone acetyltransferase subunit NuA4-domain-containing protein [Hysterangium stoloniferum]
MDKPLDTDASQTTAQPAVSAIPESSAQVREAYAKTKQELLDALTRKRALDKQLVQCEVQIYNLEATYLSETSGNAGGNIIQGFDGYLKNPGVNKRRAEVSDADRMFSNSSSTYAKSLELQADDSDTASEAVNKFPPQALQTVMLPPAPRQQELQTASMQKKDRDRLYQRQKRARKDSRATVSGDENDYSAVGSGSTIRRKRVKNTIDDD